MFQFLSRTIWIGNLQNCRCAISYHCSTHLNIPNINVVRLPVLGKGTGLAHGVLNEVISNLKNKRCKKSEIRFLIRHLQKDVFYILVQLLSRINFLDQLTQPFLVQNLLHDI